MIQPHRLDATVLVARPGQHRHRVGGVEEQRSWLGNLLDFLAEAQERHDASLRVQDPARADGIPTH